MEPLLTLLVVVPAALGVFALLRSGPRVFPYETGNPCVVYARHARFDELADGTFRQHYTDGDVLTLSTRSEGRQRGERVTACLALAEPLPFALSIATRWEAGRSDVYISQDFDQRFCVQTERPDRAQRVILSGLKSALSVADATDFEIAIDQDQVAVTGRWLTDSGQVARVCDLTLTLARSMIEAERKLPELLPWGTVALAWQRAARELGAHFDRDARVLSTSTPLGTLRLHPQSERDELWFGELRFELTRPVPVAFDLSDESGRSLWERLSRADLQVGDAELDAAFFVTSPDPDRARPLLSGDLAKLLVALKRRTTALHVTEGFIEARFEGEAVTDADELALTLEAALAAGEALAMAARPPSRGVYR